MPINMLTAKFIFFVPTMTFKMSTMVLISFQWHYKLLLGWCRPKSTLNNGIKTNNQAS